MDRHQLHLWFLATTLVLASCTESFKPEGSTETGNPPAIDSELVALVVTSDEVHVRGEAGAVTPPDGDVEVTVVRTQAVTSGPVEDDGSFDVEVQASINDVFEVRAVLGDDRSPAVIVIRGGAQVVEGDGGVLSCEQKVDLARMVFEEAFADADKSCVTNDDCKQVYGGTGCYSGCPYGYLSDDGVASLNAAVESIDTGLCEGYEPECGELFALPCVAQPEPICEGGQCVVDSGASGECTSCLSSEISWFISSPGQLPADPTGERVTLSGCNDVTRTSPTGEVECTTQITQCPTPFGGTAISSILSVLAAEDVMAAFAAGGTHGQPDESSGYVYEITIGDQSISYHTCAGEGFPACEPTGGLEDLRELLDGASRITFEGVCSTANEACTADFEGGTCDALFNVWWHDPATQSCVRKEYGGCDGNANRYNSLEECQAACPPPTSQAECGDDRELIDTCFECGPVGGCSASFPTCAKQCSSNADCAGEEPSLPGPPAIPACNTTDGVCMVTTVCL